MDGWVLNQVDIRLALGLLLDKRDPVLIPMLLGHFPLQFCKLKPTQIDLSEQIRLIFGVDFVIKTSLLVGAINKPAGLWQAATGMEVLKMPLTALT